MALCWCPECEGGNLAALKRDRQAREFARLDGDQFAEAIGLLYGPAARKAVEATLTKEAPVAHIIRDNGTDYDEFSAGLVRQAVAAVVGEPPVPVLNKSTPPPQAAADQWAGLLTVYSRCLAGDPVAVSSWAAIESHSPGLARLVVKAAGTTSGKVTKVRKPKAAKSAPASTPRDPEFSAWLSGLAASGNHAAMRVLIGG